MLLLPVANHPLAGPILALASTLAGNLFIVGSIANIIVVDQAAQMDVRITWREHARIGIPVTGLTLAIGWPGQWSASFTRDNANGLRVRAGQELTHFKLHAGEEVRTPLIVMQFWKGDRIRSQNLWRQWMLKHNLPNPPSHQWRLVVRTIKRHAQLQLAMLLAEDGLE
jgi:di/tricarboxylate transporter